MGEVEKIYDLEYVGVNNFDNPIWRCKELNSHYGDTDMLIPCEKLGIGKDAESINRYYRGQMDRIKFVGKGRFDEVMGTSIKTERFRLIDTEVKKQKWER